MADGEGVHRLTNILTEEVSLVDRPANERPFLVVKREGSMTELRPDGRGGFRRVAKAEAEGAEDEAEKARAAKAKEDEEKAAAAEDEEKKKAAKAAEEAAKAKPPPFGGNKAPPFGKKPKDEAEEKARKFLEEPGMIEALKALIETTPAHKADAEGMKLAEEVAALAEELEELAEDMKGEEADEPSDVHMKKLMASHKKIGGMCEKYMSKTAKRVMAKVGAKMSAPRLAMFKESLSTLQSLLAELLETPGSAKEHAADPGDPQGKGAGWSAANPSAAPGNAKGEDAVKALQKRVEEQAAELATLRKSVPSSQARTPGESVAKSGGDDAWPVNFNAPEEREKITKNGRFV